MSPARAFLLIVATALVALAPGARAEPSANQPTSQRDPSLTQERLRRCIAMDIANDDQKALMDEAEKALADARKATRDLGRDIDRRRRELDRADPEAVRDFNDIISQHDELRAAQETSREVFNELVDAFNPMVEKFNAACAGAAYPWRERYDEKQRQLKAREAARARSGS